MKGSGVGTYDTSLYICVLQLIVYISLNTGANKKELL